MSGWPRLLFGFSDPVDRRTYLTAGVVLMALKYGGEGLLHLAYTGDWLAPWRFLSPLLIHRAPGSSSTGFFVLLLAWTLPFAWIGASMSVRRSVDAGLSPWFGTLFVVPLVNFVVMLTLAALPSRRPAAWADRRRMSVLGLRSIFLTGTGLAALALALLLFSTRVARDYGASLFLAAPCLVGAVAAFLLNRSRPLTLARTLSLVTAGVFGFALLVLLVALEGLACIVMTLPIAIAFALVGATLGYAIARFTRSGAQPALLSLAVLPLLVSAEARWNDTRPAAVLEVVSSIDVAAPPERVWESVVAFSELPPPRELLFRAGVAYPVRATIEGTGRGAIRRCQFSTGTFVEPVTRWEPPRRLSFDVAAQPDPLRELSPYGPIRAPHLDGFFSATAGEFRLVPLPGGGTRLEGSTWYRLRIHPVPYWRLFADAIVHRIHLRVLDHIRALAERSPGVIP
jgi:hypothetical protein